MTTDRRSGGHNGNREGPTGQHGSGNKGKQSAPQTEEIEANLKDTAQQDTAQTTDTSAEQQMGADKKAAAIDQDLGGSGNSGNGTGAVGASRSDDDPTGEGAKQGFLSTLAGKTVAGIGVLAAVAALYMAWQNPWLRDLVGRHTPTEIVLDGSSIVLVPGELSASVQDQLQVGMISTYKCRWKVADIELSQTTCTASGGSLVLDIPADVLGEGEIETELALSASVIKDGLEVAALETASIRFYRKIRPSISVEPKSGDLGWYYAPVEIELSALLNGQPAEWILADNESLLGAGSECMWNFPDLPHGVRPTYGPDSKNCKVALHLPNEMAQDSTSSEAVTHEVQLYFSPEPKRDERFELPVEGSTASLPWPKLKVRYTNFQLNLPSEVLEPGDQLDIGVRPLLRDVAMRCRWEVTGNDHLHDILQEAVSCQPPPFDVEDLLPGPELAQVESKITASVSLEKPVGQKLPGTATVVSTTSGAVTLRNFSGFISTVRDDGHRVFRPNDNVTIVTSVDGIDDGRLPDGWTCSVEIDTGHALQIETAKPDSFLCSASFPAPKPEHDYEQMFKATMKLKDQHGNLVEETEASFWVAPHNPNFHAFLVDESAKMAEDWDGKRPIDEARVGVNFYRKSLLESDATVGVYRFGGGFTADGTSGCTRHEWHTPFSYQGSIDAKSLNDLDAKENSAEEAPLTAATEAVIRAFNDEPKRTDSNEAHLNLIFITRDGPFCDNLGNPSSNPREVFPIIRDQNVDLIFMNSSPPIYLIITDDIEALAERHRERSQNVESANDRPYIVVPIENSHDLDLALKLTSLMSDVSGRADGCGGLSQMLNDHGFETSRRFLTLSCQF